jgi:hypothetical protein
MVCEAASATRVGSPVWVFVFAAGNTHTPARHTSRFLVPFSFKENKREREREREESLDESVSSTR